MSTPLRILFSFSTHATTTTSSSFNISTVDEFSFAASSTADAASASSDAYKPTYFSMVTEKERCVLEREKERERESARPKSLVSIVIEFQHLDAVQPNGSRCG